MTFQERAYQAFVDHFPLMALIAVILWWLFPLMWKRMMNNGGGDQMKKLIEAENDKQSVKTEQTMRNIIAEHEKNERERLMELRDEERRETDKLAKALSEHDGRLRTAEQMLERIENDVCPDGRRLRRRRPR